MWTPSRICTGTSSVLMYVNDIHNAIPEVNIKLIADDKYFYS